MANIKAIFGVVLKQARKDKGISQEQLAFDSGLDRSYISKLEVGSYQPSISTIFVIAEVLDIIPDKLVSDVYDKYIEPSSKQK